jgi:hypothetical protein
MRPPLPRLTCRDDWPNVPLAEAGWHERSTISEKEKVKYFASKDLKRAFTLKPHGKLVLQRTRLSGRRRPPNSSDGRSLATDLPDDSEFEQTPIMMASCCSTDPICSKHRLCFPSRHWDGG